LLTTRIAALVCAAFISAFFAASLYSSFWQEEAVSYFNSDKQPVAKRLPVTLKYLSRAAKFDPGTDTEFLQAVAEVGAGSDAEAVDTLKAIVKEEPDNYRAWVLMSEAAKRAGNSALAKSAQKQYRRLVPLTGS